MSVTNISYLLEQARATRARARRVRALTDDVEYAEARAALADYAGELEKQANELDARAAFLRKTIERSDQLTKEMAHNLSETKQLLSEIGGTIRSLGNKSKTRGKHITNNISITPSVRDRLSRSAEEALKRLDEVLADAALERVLALREVLDDLMRAAARVRLELEGGIGGGADLAGRHPRGAERAILVPLKKLD